MKANGSMLVRLEIAGIGENKQKYLNLIVVPQVRLQNQIS